MGFNAAQKAWASALTCIYIAALYLKDLFISESDKPPAQAIGTTTWMPTDWLFLLHSAKSSSMKNLYNDELLKVYTYIAK